MLTWHYVTSAEYKAAGPEAKTADKLFFLSDTKQIYRGTDLFTESVTLFTGKEPETPAVNRLYVNSATLEGKIYNGSAWQTVIQPVQATLDKADTSKPVSGKAVADHVAAEIVKIAGSGELVKDVGYTKESNTLVVTMADGKTVKNIPMENVGANLKYDKATGALQILNAAGVAIGGTVNLDLERFVKTAEYDPESHEIKLTFNDGETPLAIDVGDLVDTYTAGATETVTMAVVGNQFTAEVKIAADEGHTDNLLKKTTGGLYVAPVDLSGKMDKVTPAADGNLAVLGTDGQAKDSGVKVGGAALDGTPSDKTLATEKAVDAIRTALQAAIDDKMAKMAAGTADEIVTSTADGEVKRSGLKAGTETLVGTSATTLATEKAVKTALDALNVGSKMDKDTDAVADNLAKFDGSGNAVDAGLKAGAAALAAETSTAASDKVLATEKAVVAALEWKTTV